MDLNEHTTAKLFESGSEDDQDFGEIRPLYNALPPNIDIKHERIRHRMLAYLLANGRTQEQAAAEMGYTGPWVSQIARQPWFQELMLEEKTRSGRQAVDELIRGAAPGSVLTLMELRDSAESESVRFNASKELLNRYLGNTTVVLRREEEASSNVVEEVERLEQQANRLRSSSET